MARLTFVVEADVPHEASLSEVKEFIQQWLECGGGCRPPEDPLFHSLGNVKVKVAPVQCRAAA